MRGKAALAILINVVVFKAVWIACVWGAAHGLPWLGPVAAAACLALHLWLAPNPRPEVVLAVFCGGLGVIGEGALIASGLVSFAGTSEAFPLLPPPWLIAMWVAFSTLMNVSFRWLRGRAWLSILLGATLGPLAYHGGANMGGMSFHDPEWQGLVAVAILWGVAMPVLVVASQRLDGWAGSRPGG